MISQRSAHKISASKATIILSTQVQDIADPVMNLLLDFYAQQDDAQILVIEQGEEPSLSRLNHGNKVDLLFAFNPDKPNSAWANNLGALATESPILLFIDQTLIPLNALKKAIDVCQTQAVAVNLFSRTRTLKPKEQQNLAKKQPILPPFDLYPSEKSSNYCFGGFCIKKDLFISLGGFDERLHDEQLSRQDMSVKLNRSGVLLSSFDNILGLKLNREKPSSLSPKIQSSIEDERNNQSPQAFAFACDVHRQLMGNNNKFVSP